MIVSDSQVAKKAILGVVFCGGESKRMGFDKATAPLGPGTLIERSVAGLADVVPEVVLASGEFERYPELGLECVLDRDGGSGPLAALEAGLRHARLQHGEGWVCVLPCDSPRADGRVFAHLLARAQRVGAQACLLETEQGPQPLYAVYSTDCLEPVAAALDAGERRMIAWHEGYGAVEVTGVRLSDLPAEIARSCADNVNTPEELDRQREVRP